MKIILLRHGKPILPHFDKMTGSEFNNWIDAYNNAALDNDCPPTDEALAISKSCNYAICSTLRRSIESSKELGLMKTVEISNGFIEAGLPSYNVFNLKFSNNFWLIFFRALWLLGCSPGAESYPQAKLRAKKCANKLVLTAEANESVIFVGHGILNKLISKELIRLGWQKPSENKNSYWDFSVYKNET